MIPGVLATDADPFSEVAGEDLPCCTGEKTNPFEIQHVHRIQCDTGCFKVAGKVQVEELVEEKLKYQNYLTRSE